MNAKTYGIDAPPMTPDFSALSDHGLTTLQNLLANIRGSANVMRLEDELRDEWLRRIAKCCTS